MSRKSSQIGRDAAASPGGDLPTPGMRSIYERMTNPTPDDMNVTARLQGLGRSQIGQMINHLGQVLEHMAAQRSDMTVRREQDATGWTIRVEMR